MVKPRSQVLGAFDGEKNGRAGHAVEYPLVPQQLVPTFSPFLFGWEGSPTKIDYRRKGYPYCNLSNLEDLVAPWNLGFVTVTSSKTHVTLR